MTTVSVVIPTRNRGRLLVSTLHSVLRQRAVDLQVIVVDEASTDDTSRVVAGLRDPRIDMLRHDRPRGLSAARNHGAERAMGAWLAFVDDDDVWAPDKLTSLVAAADREGREWAYGGVVNIDDDLRIVSGGSPPAAEEAMVSLPRSNPIPGGGSNVVLLRNTFNKAGGFDERFRICADWELWARLARRGPPAVVSRPLVGYRLHGANMSLDTDLIRKEAELIESVHRVAVDWGKLHRWLAESCLRMDRRMEAIGHFARAAGRGQAPGVASDLLAILRRRLLRGGAGPSASGKDAWFAEATPWLRELGSLTAGPGDGRGP